MAKRILHVVTDMNRGGLETMLMNYYRNVDRDKIQFDFLTHRNYAGDYDDEIKAMGGLIYHIPRLNPFSARYKKALRSFFKNHPVYNVIHVHQDCMSSVVLEAAEEAGIPVRIAHCHNSDQDRNFKYPIKLYYRERIEDHATHLMACSIDAGDWMFKGGDYQIIPNAINVSDYACNEDKRREVRAAFGFDDKDFVIGHVGRFMRQKNHGFLIDVFDELNRMTPAKLILVGDGELKKSIEKKVESMGLSDRVIFTGVRDDVPDILRAMDIFLFPSQYEGLPLTLIEAQASGLPCYISDQISDEAVVTGNVTMMSLMMSARAWAKRIFLSEAGCGKATDRRDNTEAVRSAGFDIADNAEKLQEFYLGFEDDIENGDDNTETKTPLLTVFTPTYNRAHTLERTYQSLREQNSHDFLWLIIDDGSTDNTGELVEKWQKEDNSFEIKYIYKENGGMHTAHNTAYENIHTELNTCIDSDDVMAPDGVKKIAHKWEQVRDKGYAGILGLDAYMTGEIIDKGFRAGTYETTLSGYYASGGRGDKKLVYRTDVINAYPSYPVFDDEKYMALAYKYRMIDEDFKLAVLDEVLCLVDYQDDGSTRNMMSQYANNPKGFARWRKLCMEHPVSGRRLIADSIHYVSSSFISGNKDYIEESPRKLATVICTPAGWALSRFIIRKTGTAKEEKLKETLKNTSPGDINNASFDGRKSVLFLIHDLGQGGAEKVLVNLANRMDKSKFDVTVMSIFDVGENKKYLDENIRYRYRFSHMPRGNSHIMKAVSPERLHDMIVGNEHYDVEIAYLEGSCARIISGCRDESTKKIAWIHSTQETKAVASRSFRSYREARKCYNRFDEIVAVSQGVKEEFEKTIKPEKELKVIRNTVDPEQIRIMADCKADRDGQDKSEKGEKAFTMVGVGKLTDSKGFDKLIRITAMLRWESYPVRLMILGDGPRRTDLENLADRYGIGECVAFAGYVENPYRYMAECDLFVCASQGEGFSTAVTEALILGLPICTVDVGGMRELLGENNEYGVITPKDEISLYKGILSMLSNQDRLEHYRKQARERAECFDSDETVRRAEKIIEER